MWLRGNNEGCEVSNSIAHWLVCPYKCGQSRHVLAGFFVSDQSWFTEVIPPRSHAVKSLRITEHCVLSFGMKSCVRTRNFCCC
jgi:hypothetical protein